MRITIICMMVLAGSAFALDRNEYYRVIDTDCRSKEYAPCISALEKAIAEYPDEPDFYSNLVYMYTEAGRFDSARSTGSEAVKRFPKHRYVLDSYRCALVASGWDCVNRDKKADAYAHFKTAFDQFPDDSEVISGYGHILYKMKKPQQAVRVLADGHAKHPDSRDIRLNLSWSYFSLGDSLWDAGNKQEAGACFRKAYDLGDRNDPELYVTYLYRLPRFGAFREGGEVLSEAAMRFGNNEDVYRAGFWLFHAVVDYHRNLKEYGKMIQALKALYLFSSRNEIMYEEDMSFSHFAVSKANLDIDTMIEAICPYWRAFSESERLAARSLLDELKKDLPEELEFSYHNLLGHVLFRENNVREAREEFTKAYDTFVKLPLARRYRYREAVDIPFPLKGIFTVENYDSAHRITHMGLNRFSYDIYGCDEKGSLVRPGVNERQSVLTDWLGFGVPVYSPVDGTVIEAVGGHPDDRPYPAAPGRGNHIDIRRSDGKILHFCHLQQGSVRHRKGDAVLAGEQIGRVGNSSSSTPHLHFCVYSKDWLVTYPVYFTDYTAISDGKRNAVRKGQPSVNEANREIVEAK